MSLESPSPLGDENDKSPWCYSQPCGVRDSKPTASLLIFNPFVLPQKNVCTNCRKQKASMHHQEKTHWPSDESTEHHQTAIVSQQPKTKDAFRVEATSLCMKIRVSWRKNELTLWSFQKKNPVWTKDTRGGHIYGLWTQNLCAFQWDVLWTCCVSAHSIMCIDMVNVSCWHSPSQQGTSWCQINVTCQKWDTCVEFPAEPF